MLYDLIVQGTGGVGSAALFHAALRGLKVLGIDRFHPPHAFGSSHGRTRIIRQAYFEHPAYVPLVLHSYHRWRELEQRTGKKLLNQIGIVEIGPPDGTVLAGVRRAAEEHVLALDDISPQDFSRRFPDFVLPKGCDAVFEPTAGYLLVEECVAAHLQAAHTCGAELATGTQVLGWQSARENLKVQTDQGEFLTKKLIITPGPWANQALKIRLPLQVLRKQVHWFEDKFDKYHENKRQPCFFYELPHGCFYGFPQVNAAGVKIAEHTGGTPVSDPFRDCKDRETEDFERVQAFAKEYLPGLSGEAIEHSVCYYTMSPDGNFIVDLHPADRRVAFAAGLSGHGFKFTPALGEALVDLVWEGKTPLPVDFLKRPSE